MLSHPPTTQTTMLCSTTSSEHYMPLDYTKPAPNPTSNSPNVGLPCPPPIATETLEQFNSPPNCSGYHPNVRSALSHSSSPFTCERHALEKGGNSHRSGMCQSFVFNLLKHFGLQRLLLYSSCNFAGFGQKGENSERRMCQSPRIPMPKFSISRVSISHGLSSSKEQDLFSRLLEYFNYLWISIQIVIVVLMS